MLVVVTVEAQQLPVAAIGGVVFKIMVFVMNRQFAQVLAGKITAATCADPGENLEGLFPVFDLFHGLIRRSKVTGGRTIASGGGDPRRP